MPLNNHTVYARNSLDVLDQVRRSQPKICDETYEPNDPRVVGSSLLSTSGSGKALLTNTFDIIESKASEGRNLLQDWSAG
mmetsp:Transcript_14243/g.31168  ORF Transcript_14243/g.31168 Transcript_14243/m.31168 type:complete len:80 (+) Transcript_14243:953-1192(+)